MMAAQNDTSMCEELNGPPGGSSGPGEFNVDTLQRGVGSIVRVLCANRTVAVLECKPTGHWNGTVPGCAATGIGGDDDGHLSNMGTILIVVWVLGGILLFTLLILITVIISSRKKPARRVNGQQPTTVFQISGQEGGDNPAFSRSEERTGSTSRLSTLESDGNGTNDRLPSYHEAVMGGYIQSPIGNNAEPPYFLRVNAPPSYRTSQLNRPTTAQTATSTSSAIDTHDGRDANTQQISSHSNPLVTQATVHSTQSRQQQSTARTSGRGRERPVPTVSSSSSSETQLSQASQRYVESYPGCFWEEDPPPPYTPGPSNIHLYRSPSRNTQHRRSLPPRPRQRQPDFSNSSSTIPPPPMLSSTPQLVNSTSTAIPTAPHAARTSQSQNSNVVPSSQEPCSTATGSQMPYVVPSDSTTCHFSTINVLGNGHHHHHHHPNRQHQHHQQQQQLVDYGGPTTHHNPSMFSSRTTAVHQHRVPLHTSRYGHNRSLSHGNPNLTHSHSPTNLQPDQTVTSSQEPLYPTRHNRQGSAPIARLEVEYF